MAESVRRSRWGALPEGEKHDPAIKAGRYAMTPNGRALVLWIHHDHQWEFGRRVHTTTYVRVQYKSGAEKTFTAAEVRA